MSYPQLTATLLKCLFRGALTGKYKKGDPLPEGSRLAFAKKSGLDQVGSDGAPDMEKLWKDENYWRILDVMGKVAKNHGNQIQFFYFILSIERLAMLA